MELVTSEKGPNVIHNYLCASLDGTWKSSLGISVCEFFLSSGWLKIEEQMYKFKEKGMVIFTL